MVSGTGMDKALQIAKGGFLGLPVADLSVTDLTNNADTGLNGKTKGVALGTVDVFMSHSWRDPGAEKFAALTNWHTKWQKENQKPSALMWLDKACINQSRIEEQLACLPIFLAGCRELLALVGDTYGKRLWCVMELFTFVRMGGEFDRIAVVPLHSDASDDLKDVLKGFDASTAQCYDPADRQHLLAIIESGFGNFTAFNAIVKSIFKVRRRMSLAVTTKQEPTKLFDGNGTVAPHSLNQSQPHVLHGSVTQPHVLHGSVTQPHVLHGSATKDVTVDVDAVSA